MRLLSPINLWFLTLLIPFIAMYILKRKNEEIIIPSNMLWHEAIDNLQASTPWERLRTNILFFLQLLTILALIFSLVNPFIYSKLSGYSKNIIVIDNSGSMNYKTKNFTKLEESKLEAERLVDSLPNKAEVTLITTSPNSEILLSSSKDKKQVKNLIKAIEKSNSTSSNEEVISLIKSIANNEKNLAYYYFTDDVIEIEGVKGDVINLNGVLDNLILQNLSTTSDDEGVDAIATITNTSKDNKNVEIALYGDDKLLQIKEVNIKGTENYNVQFDKISKGVSVLRAEIDIDDGLKEDNYFYNIVNQTNKKKVLMISEKNIFFEKAMSIRNDIELFKTNNPEEIKSGYDIYIYDGILPESLPTDGNILITNLKDENKFIGLESQTEGGSAIFNKSSITDYIEGESFQLATFSPIKLSGNLQSFIEINNKVAGVLGTLNNHKVVVMGFNIHDSDMPLTHNFPILMNNIINYLSGNNMLENRDITCGESVKVSILNNVDNIKIIDSNNKEENFSNESAEVIYNKTANPGIYKVIQKSKDKEIESLFSVNFPREESVLKENKDKKDINIVDKENSISGISLMTPLLIASLIFISLEWIGYIKINSNNKN